MFPQNPEFPFLDCDKIYTKSDVVSLYSQAAIIDFDLEDWGEGINRIDQKLFEERGKRFIDWCKSKASNRVIIVSHDGTITHYRVLLGEQGLTRNNFLGEGGIYRITV